MRKDLEERIAQVASRQHGLVTRAQLVEIGVSGAAIGRRARSGRMRALHRGVYLAVPLPLPFTGVMAALLASGEGAVARRYSAALLWSLTEEVPSTVDVWVPGNRGNRAGIRPRRLRAGDIPSADVREVHGMRVTSPARTLLDLAPVLGPRELETMVARAEREGLVTIEELTALVDRNRGRAGARALRHVLTAAGGPALTRSKAESHFLHLVRRAGLSAPECNVSVGSFEIDCLWRREGIAVEIDGYRYHASRPRFEADRRKDALLLAKGIKVMRFTWRQITEAALATMVQLGQALALAGVSRGN